MQAGQHGGNEGPEDPAGDIAAEREGYMTGNRVFLYFRNTTELSDWPKSNVSRWPNNLNGLKMVDGIGLLIGAKVYIKDDPNNLIDSEVITDTTIISAGKDLHELYYLQTSYREEMDVDPTGTVEYGLYPVFGYFNPNNEYPALSRLPDSWPSGGWPSAEGPIWPGEWNGRFGRGVTYADLETYFVVNDAHDLEYLGEEDMVKYYPRYSSKSIDETSSIQSGQTWGGLGIRVENRGFQWNNPQARDAIFWEYNIANTSEYDRKCLRCFGNVQTLSRNPLGAIPKDNHLFEFPVFAKRLPLPMFNPRAYLGLQNGATNAEKHGASEFTAPNAPKSFKKLFFYEVAHFEQVKTPPNSKILKKNWKYIWGGVIFANTGILKFEPGVPHSR